MDVQTARTMTSLHRTEIGKPPVCYVAGPMTGIPNFNFEAFDAAAAVMREAGWFVYNPADNDRERGEEARPDGVPQWKLKHYMEIDLAQVCKSDAIFMLKGWEESKGATLEFNVADAVDVPAYTFDTAGRIEIVGTDGDGQIVAVDHAHLVGAPDAGMPTPTQAPLMSEESFTGVALDDNSKATNPKDAIGSSKLPLHLWPAVASAYGCMALLEGALKYGRNNWREAGVRYSIYHDALLRHLSSAWEGEWVDPESGLPHLSHALACLAIIVDASEHDRLVDDRQYRGGGFRRVLGDLTPEVTRLKDKYHDRTPKHYDIRDDGGKDFA